MREALFRGKSLYNGEWVYGSHYKDLNGNEYIVPINWLLICDSEIVVLHETVGQFTGLLDKNGNKIFEGDIIRADGSHYLTVVIDEHTGGYKGQAVVWDKHEDDDYNTECDYFEMAEYEVIGNIHDNKELLK